MSRTRIPFLNSLRFTPYDQILPEGVNNYTPDIGMFWAQKRDYETGLNYCYKAQRADSIGVFVDSLNDNLIAYLVDNNGVIVTPFSASPGHSTIAGNTVEIDTTVYAYNSYFFRLEGFGDTIPDGVYFLVLELSGFASGDAPTEKFISEPISVKADGHKGTMLIEYADSRNRQDVYTSEYFSMRVESILQLTDMPTSVVQFQDQNNQTKIISAIPKRQFTFTAGGVDASGDSRGVPAYVADKIARIMCCEEIYIDKVRYIRAGEAGIKINRYEKYTGVSCSIEVQEFRIDSQLVYKPEGEYTVFTYSEGVTDFAVWPFTLTTTEASYTTPKRIIRISAGDAALYTEELNALGFPGIFYFLGRSLIYRLTRGEYVTDLYIIYSAFTGYQDRRTNAMLMEGYFRYWVEKTVSGAERTLLCRLQVVGTLGMQVQGIVLTSGLTTTYPYSPIDCFEALGVFNGDLTLPSAFNGFTEVSWYYRKVLNPSESYFLSIDFDAPTSGISLAPSPSRQASGSMPTSLKRLVWVNQRRARKMDFLVQDCTNLEQLQISVSPLMDGFNQNPFLDNKPNFTLFYLSYCDLWTAVLNDFLVNFFYINTPVRASTSLKIWSLNINPTSPWYTSSSTTARNALISEGWSVPTS